MEPSLKTFFNSRREGFGAVGTMRRTEWLKILVDIQREAGRGKWQQQKK